MTTTPPKTKSKLILPDDDNGGGIAGKATRPEDVSLEDDEAAPPKAGMRAKRCETCACGFFLKTNPMGTCRRMPPTVTIIPVPRQLAMDNQIPFVPINVSQFPQVHTDSYCIDGYRPVLEEQH